MHLYNSTSVLQRARRVRHWTRTGIIDIALEGARLVPKLERDACPSTRRLLRVLAGVLHRHRARVRGRGLQRRSSRSASRRPTARSSSTCRPPSRWPRRTSTPTRSSGCTATWPTARTSSCRCTRTTTAAPPSPPPSSATWPAPTASRAACSATASAPATSPRHAGPQPVQPGHRPADRLLRHRRDPAHRRVLQPAAGPRAPPLRRRPGLHGLLRLAPGRHQEGLRGHGARRRGRRASTVDEHRPGRCPYLPIDPKDVGRSYEAVIRVNSQSGKGGVAYIMKTEHALDLPRRLQIEFCQVVQRIPTTEGGEVTPRSIWAIFADEYLPAAGPTRWGRFAPCTRRPSATATAATSSTSSAVRRRRSVTSSTARGNGPIAAFFDALAPARLDVRVLDYAEHALSARAATPRPRPTSSAPSASACSGASASTRTSSRPRSRPSSPPSTALRGLGADHS